MGDPANWLCCYWTSNLTRQEKCWNRSSRHPGPDLTLGHTVLNVFVGDLDMAGNRLRTPAVHHVPLSSLVSGVGSGILSSDSPPFIICSDHLNMSEVETAIMNIDPAYPTTLLHSLLTSLYPDSGVTLPLPKITAHLTACGITRHSPYTTP